VKDLDREGQYTHAEFIDFLDVVRPPIRV
jgi:hypothetical protein